MRNGYSADRYRQPMSGNPLMPIHGEDMPLKKRTAMQVDSHTAELDYQKKKKVEIRPNLRMNRFKKNICYFSLTVDGIASLVLESI